MACADIKKPAQIGELQRFCVIFLDVGACLPDEARMRADRLLRLAPAACAEAGMFGSNTLVEKLHLRAARPAGRAGRAAINSRRTDRVKSPAVKIDIPFV